MQDHQVQLIKVTDGGNLKEDHDNRNREKEQGWQVFLK